jgi:hypothetical protein
VKLSAACRRRLKLSAAYLEREISQIVEDAVTEYLDRTDQQRQAQGLPLLPRPA